MIRSWSSPDERRAEVAWRRGYGYSLRAIATALGIRKEIVKYDLDAWAREHPGQPPPGGPQAKRDQRMAEAARLRAAGLSLREISGKLRCAHTTVRNDLLRWDQTNVTLFKSVVQERVPGAVFEQPDATPKAEIIPLRRSS